MEMVQKMVWLSAAGALGTLSRYGLSTLVQKVSGSSFPWGTFVVNMTGCLLAGFFWTLFEGRLAVSGETRILVLVGFMGSFTTFSAMILETGMLLRSAEWMAAVVNLAIQNVFGLGIFLAGMALGKML